MVQIGDDERSLGGLKLRWSKYPLIADEEVMGETPVFTSQGHYRDIERTDSVRR